MRVAVTGAAGRLGSALVAALADAPFTGPAGPIAWARAAFDLDAPDGVGGLLDRDRPEVVVHAAAWTDVDGCALDPALAMARNAVATGILAEACAVRGTDLLVVSTNEVFDGSRTDGRPYEPADPVAPGNPYGASKAEGERLAAAAFDARPGASLGIARTAWLFGAPGRDFPSRILDAAERARAAGEPLRAVGDEWGTPTYTADVADAIVELLADDAVARHPPPGQRAVRDAGRLGPLRRHPGRAGGRGRQRPVVDLGAPVAPATLGRPRADPAAVRGTDARLAGRDGRLRAIAPARRRDPGVNGERPASALAGVRYGAIERHADSRGSFRELWRAGAFPAEPFVQANLSSSAAGVLRGLHLHRRQDDLWIVGAGLAFVALVDARPLLDGSGPSAIVETRELRADEWVLIPTGVAHGFLALEPLELIYLVTNEYDGSDELGFAWDDQAVGVPWPALDATPDGRPILSGRDQSNPSLRELVVRLRDSAI